MNENHKKIMEEFDAWKNSPPNLVQRGLGLVGTPFQFILDPFIQKITPLLEAVIKKINSIIADIIKNSDEDPEDIFSLTEEEFQNWIKKKGFDCRKLGSRRSCSTFR